MSWDTALVRGAPKEGDVVMRLVRGTRVKLVGRQNDWYKVEHRGKTGWMCPRRHRPCNRGPRASACLETRRRLQAGIPGLRSSEGASVRVEWLGPMTRKFSLPFHLGRADRATAPASATPTVDAVRERLGGRASTEPGVGELVLLTTAAGEALPGVVLYRRGTHRRCVD